MRSAKHLLKPHERLATQPQVCQFKRYICFVEHADDDFLAQDGGHGRHTQVNLATVGHDVHATFLREALLGDIHLPDDLDSRHDGGVHACRRRHQRPQLAVQAVADRRAAPTGLDVNVAGAVAHGRQDDQTHEIHDGAAVDHLVQVGQRSFVDGFDLGHPNVAFLDGSQERIDFHFRGQVFDLEFSDVGFQRQDRSDLTTCEILKPIDGGQRLRLGHGDRQGVADLEHRERLKPLGLFFIQHFGDFGIDQAVA